MIGPPREFFKRTVRKLCNTYHTPNFGVAPKRPAMNSLPATWIALCALAFVLGLKHGFDADHLATIDGLTRYNARANPRLNCTHSAGLCNGPDGDTITTSGVHAVA